MTGVHVATGSETRRGLCESPPLSLLKRPAAEDLPEDVASDVMELITVENVMIETNLALVEKIEKERALMMLRIGVCKNQGCPTWTLTYTRILLLKPPEKGPNFFEAATSYAGPGCLLMPTARLRTHTPRKTRHLRHLPLLPRPSKYPIFEAFCFRTPSL